MFFKEIDVEKILEKLKDDKKLQVLWNKKKIDIFLDYDTFEYEIEKKKKK